MNSVKIVTKYNSKELQINELELVSIVMLFSLYVIKNSKIL